MSESGLSLIEVFAQYGLLGAVLAWFMWRNERVLNKLIDKIDLLCREIEPRHKPFK